MVSNWVNRSGYWQGVFWIIISCFFSNLSDVLTKFVGDLPAFEVGLIRFGVGGVILFFLALSNWPNLKIKINNVGLNLWRIVVGFAATTIWILGVTKTSLAVITAISFCCPIFILPLASIFLKEKVNLPRITAVLISFIGVLVVAYSEKNGGFTEIGGLHFGVVCLVLAAVLFATSDLLNKKIASSESMFALLFSYYWFSFLLAFFPAILNWMPIKPLIWIPLIGIGGCSLLTLYAILKAVKATDISALSPYKYVEMIFSILFGYCLFHEHLSLAIIVGIVLILSGTICAILTDQN